MKDPFFRTRILLWLSILRIRKKKKVTDHLFWPIRNAKLAYNIYFTAHRDLITREMKNKGKQ